MAEFSLGTQETAGKLWNGKLTAKEHREGPSQLVLKVGFLERGLGQGSQQNSGRERYSTGLSSSYGNDAWGGGVFQEQLPSIG